MLRHSIDDELQFQTICANAVSFSDELRMISAYLSYDMLTWKFKRRLRDAYNANQYLNEIQIPQ